MGVSHQCCRFFVVAMGLFCGTNPGNKSLFYPTPCLPAVVQQQPAMYNQRLESRQRHPLSVCSDCFSDSLKPMLATQYSVPDEAMRQSGSLIPCSAG